MGKHVNKRMVVKTEFKKLSTKEWGAILCLPFPPATRECICLLFLGGGSGLYDLLSMSCSNQLQINQFFIKKGLPYRVRNFGISKKRAEEIFWHHTQFVPFDERVYKQSDQCHPARIRLWVKPQETKLCTIIDC